MSEPIAVISMSGRFPGADDVQKFWENLCAGVESISRFDAPAGAPGAGNPRYVGAEGLLSDIAGFDAAFFGFSPREAEIMDPQHRLCLEAAWIAFDSAGYDPLALTDSPVGVFLAASMSAYLVRNLLPTPGLLESVGSMPLLMHNDKDSVATTISHKLGLTGPSYAVGSSCSSSLVSIHLACRSLQTFECDMALAGGVSLQVPQGAGYVYAEDGIYSPDGRCAAFDASAAGTVGGSGVAVVLLKRLSDAVRDRDCIHAVVLGSAVNNDGASKVGYTAPSLDGQSAVIVEAHAVAGINAGTIGYVEAHGTGTSMGDPIEVDALTQAFRVGTARNGFCALGSVKTNIGHLDTAAGVTGFIKTVLAVREGIIPASLHYREANPGIDFAATPFEVAGSTRSWQPTDSPRRAAVSSFGIGGTNAHVIVEQPPAPPLHPTRTPGSVHVLALSGHTAAALTESAHRLAAHLQNAPHTDMTDLAATLASRRALPARAAVVCAGAHEAIEALRGPLKASAPARPGPLVFLFPGQGAGYPGMAAQLAATEPAFADHLERCAQDLAPMDVDLLQALSCVPGTPGATQLGQPALAAVQYALACTLQDWGLTPAAMLGYSLGEYTAAALAGVMSPQDMLRLVTIRGRLQSGLAAGRMLAVPLGAREVAGLLPSQVCIAAENGPHDCVVAGDRAAVEGVEATLGARGIPTRMLAVAHPFHSPAVDPMLDAFRKALTETEFHPPHTRYLSSLTGDWIDPHQVCTPDYWLAHLRQPVRFGDALARCLELDRAAFAEIGPPGGLTGLVRRHPAATAGHLAVRCFPALGGAAAGPAEQRSLVSALGALWVAGAAVRWDDYYRPHEPSRVELPGYPFEQQHYWIDAPEAPASRPGLARLAPEIERELAAAPADLPRSIDDHPGLRSDLQLLCVALAADCLKSWEVHGAPGTRYAVDQLRSRLCILPEFARFFDFLLGVLASGGVLRRDGAEIVFLDGAGRASAREISARIVQAHPGFAGLVELLNHCAQAYPTALVTPNAALGVLYPDGSGGLLGRTLGQDTVEHSAIGRLSGALGGMLERMAAVGPVRVLEVGAGAGTLTGHIAARAGEHISYHVTDISRAHIDRLAAEAAERGLSQVSTGLLDIDRDPSLQGLGGQAYDVVCALDVLHVSADIPAALTHLRSLLAPGGVLAFIETVADDPWTSMIWGLSEGWWTYRDDRPGPGPLLDPVHWRELLSRSGFDVEMLVPETGPRDSALILAQPRAAADGPQVSSLPAAPHTDLARWGYRPGWQHAPPVTPDRSALAGPCLLLAGGAVGDAVQQQLHGYGIPVIRVLPGQPVAGVHGFDPAREEHYHELLQQLTQQGDAPRLVVHALAAEAAGASDEHTGIAGVHHAQERGLHSLLHLVRALAAHEGGEPVRLVALTAGAQAVLGEDLTRPEQATVLAAVKVIPREYPWIACTAMDIEPQRQHSHPGLLAGWVIDELLAAAETTVVAYRGRRRFVPQYLPHPLPEEIPSAPGLPRAQGTYLVCGGLGGIGLNIAEYLGRLPARVVLTSRQEFPGESQWPSYLAAHRPDDPVAITIVRLQGIWAAGGQVMVARADLTDRDELRAAIALTEERFGPLTGVVHAAGVRDTAGVIHRRTTADTEAAIAAKVYGTAELDAALGERELDFVVLCSSMAVVLHKLKYGEVGYVAANEYLHAYAAHRSARRPGVTVAIAWTDWLGSGMWADAQHELDRYRVADNAELPSDMAFRPTDDPLGGLSPAQGVELFRRAVLGAAGPELLICGQDLAAVLAQHAAYTTDHHAAIVSRWSVAGGGSRDALSAQYLPPQTDLEQMLARRYAELLGYDRVGRDDDFFELGGDSLLALRLLAQVRADRGVDVSVAQLFDTPTVAGLAGRLGDPVTPGAGWQEVML